MNNSDFGSKVKTSLDDSVQAIDADTRKRLAAMRRQSLQANMRPIAPARWLTLAFWGHPVWMPATVLLGCILFAALWLNSPTHQAISQDQMVMLELLNNTDDLEAMSDPDFYLWTDEALLEAPNHAL